MVTAALVLVMLLFPPVSFSSFLDVLPILLAFCLGMPCLIILVSRIMRQHYQKHVSMEVVCERLGLDEGTARRFAAEQGIEPRFNIGGKSLYRIEDFVDAESLLRPAVGPEELLRPARSVEQPDEMLVRPTGSNE